MKAILFDLDDTLYDRKMPFTEAFREFDSVNAEKLDMQLVHQAFVRRGNEVFDASASGMITMEEMYIYRFGKALQEFNLSCSDQEALYFQQIYDAKMHQIHMSDSICEMLDWISAKKVPMGVITNGPSVHQRDKMRALKLDHWIDETRWFISGDYQAPKPDPTMYLEAEKALKMNPCELLYIGDSYDRDILSAARQGWHTVWLNKKNEKPVQTDAKPDVIVTSEEELNTWIREKI